MLPFNIADVSHKISGLVFLVNGNPLENVGIYLDAIENPFTSTNSQGYYDFGVDNSKSATVTPKMYGYQFDPPSFLFPTAKDNQKKDFTAFKHKINGTVKEKDTGKRLEKVGIYDGKKLLAVTNIDGYYETDENAGIDFTLTAQLPGYEFPTSGIPIIGSEYLHENKDFIAKKLDPIVTIGGKVIWFNTPNSYTAAMEAYAENGSLYSRTATDVDGNYSIPVPVGWTGTVKPFSLGFYFSPEKVYYSSLKENKIQNYTVMPPFSWIGTVIFNYAWRCVKPIYLPPLTIKAYDLDGKLISTVVTGSDGIVNFALPYYWSGWVTAVSPGYTIDPPRVDAHGVTVDYHQNFYIENYNCTPE